MIASAPPTGRGEGMGGGRAVLGDAALLVAIKLAVGFWVLSQGFTHVSDDDYARTVIAEQLAHTPRLDPSGTSWLPFPFWVEGTAMLVFGRSLGVARVVAVVLGAVTVAAPYVAMRAARVPRWAALIATAIAMALPWNAWLAVATVPEGWAGALTAAGALSMRSRRGRPWGAAALLAASLSRYEAWPACAVMAALCVRGLTHEARRGAPVWREARAALLAVAGPLAWMVWNAHAHGSPLHFLARVSTFRRAIGAADVPMWDKLLGYPRALLEDTPEVALLAAVGAAGLLASAALRQRWRWPAAVVLATGVFLVAGDLGDGAPTHHAARALAGTWWLLVGMGVDAGLAAVESVATPAGLRVGAVLLFSVAGAAWCVVLPGRWRDSPGRGDSERRDAQIARGLDLRARRVSAAEITPCAFEHFALMAAWGEPERAVVHARTGTVLTEECPTVQER